MLRGISFFNNHFVSVIFFFGVLHYCFAQKKYSPKDYFDFHDYNRALTGYMKIYNKDKGDVDVNEKIGICYLNIHGDRSKAIPFLEFVHKKGNYGDDLLLNLGKAYLFSYQLDKAVKLFNDYRNKTLPKNYEIADHLIENCENAKEFMKKPVNVTFETLGKKVNSSFPDFNPFVTKDEGAIYFTSCRQGIKSSEGYYTSDIYVSVAKKGEWSSAKSVGSTVNTQQDEECTYVSPDGKRMMVYVDNEDLSIAGDLYFTQLTGKVKIFPKPVALAEPANTKANELEGWISADTSTLIISSDRGGGMGGMDLWVLKRLPTGGWGMPMNLGENINTKSDEAFPVYDEVNHTLYFSSEGHTNMGGYDIFKADFNTVTQESGKAQNMGYPINTPSDDREFVMAPNKRYGYISAFRKGGLGDLDIYKITFNDVDERLSVIKGVVMTGDSAGKDISATISIHNYSSNQELDSKPVNSKTGKYLFAVKPEKYLLKVTATGYSDFKEVITVFDKTDYVFEIQKNITLLKVGQQQNGEEKNNKPQK